MKAYPTPPRVHGNGFIQVDLDPRRRLHVWDVRLPRQCRDSSIHNHSFDFASECLEGTLVNVEMLACPALGFPTHELYRVDRVPGSEEDALVTAHELVRFEAGEATVVHPRESYGFPAMAYHASLHLGTTVTLMTRGAYHGDGSDTRVACRIGEEPDNSWVRGDHEIPGWAWDLIRRHGGAP